MRNKNQFRYQNDKKHIGTLNKTRKLLLSEIMIDMLSIFVLCRKSVYSPLVVT